MADQRCEVPISIVAVNRIDHIDWLDILNHLSPHGLIFSYVIHFPPMYGKEQVVIVTLYFHTSPAEFGLVLSLTLNKPDCFL